MIELEEFEKTMMKLYPSWDMIPLDDLLRFEAIKRIRQPEQNTVTMPTTVYERLVEEREIYKGLVEERPEPDAATEQLLQRYRDAAALRIDEIFSLREERDLAQKALSEACQGQIELAHTIKVLMAERDEMISDAAENLAHFNDTVEMEEKYKKERDELRELLRDILHADISFNDDELEQKCCLALSERE